LLECATTIRLLPNRASREKRVCSRATADGRVTLTDGTLIVTRNGTREEFPITSEAEWNLALNEYFGIVF